MFLSRYIFFTFQVDNVTQELQDVRQVLKQNLHGLIQEVGSRWN